MGSASSIQVRGNKIRPGVSTNMNQTQILLEAGTNELEIMVVEIAGIAFGVNVAKIREVILPTRVHRLPSSPESIEGVIELRGLVVELMDLKGYSGFGEFTDEEKESPTKSQILVTEFNHFVMGFRVEHVRKIERASWDQIMPVPEGLQGNNVPLVGIARLGDEVVQMLDLENILAQVKPQMAMEAGIITSKESREEKRIIVAEDSDLIRAKITSILAAAGYQHVHDFRNGLEAWEYIEACEEKDLPELVVTDIEMPLLDGLHLCKRIRERSVISEIPVILFSSLISDRTRNKGEQVGATAQIGKPELASVVGLADQFLGLLGQEQ